MKHEKNTTLGRKHATGLKKNEGVSHEPRRRDQAGDGKDFAFNGQMGDGVNRSSSTHRYAGNYATKECGQTMHENFGQGPRKGNESSSGEYVGKSATKDPHRMTIATASQGHNIEAHDRVPHITNPDAIYINKAIK